MTSLTLKILASWNMTEGNVCSTAELFDWIYSLNKNTNVSVNEISINDDSFWFYDDYKGEILNRKRSFFSIMGIRYFINENFIKEQPIIIQSEIGYLGIIAKEIDGVLNFLMQAKIEPGNVNCVQISPTIQATKSNFLRAHGGRLPLYFEYFEGAIKSGKIIYDQIQSEQGGRFYGKRNRNIIIMVDEDVPIHSNYRWMTLGQIKEMMKVDNLVNMDTRTVLSGLPFVIHKYAETEFSQAETYFSDKALFRSIFQTEIISTLPQVEAALNDYKMFKDIKQVLIPINQLADWSVNEFGVFCKKTAEFEVRYYDIAIEGREVNEWMQPLFKAKSSAIFALFTCVARSGERKFLVSLRPEIGSFDKVELGPTIQAFNDALDEDAALWQIYNRHIESNSGILKDVILSEEGGRFYHEQNRNVILELELDEIEILPEGYFWVDYSCLNFLIQRSNCLNIQLRNLLSLLDI